MQQAETERVHVYRLSGDCQLAVNLSAASSSHHAAMNESQQVSHMLGQLLRYANLMEAAQALWTASAVAIKQALKPCLCMYLFLATEATCADSASATNV